MKNVSQENSDGETVQKKNKTNDFSNLTEADLISEDDADKDYVIKSSGESEESEYEPSEPEKISTKVIQKVKVSKTVQVKQKAKKTSKTDHKTKVSVEKPIRKRKKTATAQKTGEEPQSMNFNL